MDVLIIDLSTTSTLLHEEISKRDGDGRSIGVLYFNKKKYRASEVKQKDYIRLTEQNDIDNDARELFELIENNVGIKFTRALYLDRYIDDKELLARYYAAFVKNFYRILLERKPKVVVGELSLGWEILAYGICQTLGVRYVLPLNIYLFSKPRLAFFDINHDISIIEKVASTNQEKISDKFIISEVERRKNVDINKGFGDKLARSINLNLFKRLIYNARFLDTNDYRDSLFSKARRRLRGMIYGFYNKRYLRQVGRNDLEKKYVLFMLHVQPEVTPDTTATYYSNQYEVIRQIMLRLPLGVEIYVKEHPNGMGARPNRILKEISALPNVSFLAPTVNAQDAISRAWKVLSICGTGSFEAVLMGKPGAVFNKVYFSDYSAVTRINGYAELDSFLGEDSLSPRSDGEKDLYTFYKKLYQGSFSCYWHQPYMMDGVLDSKNVDEIRRAVLRISDLNG